MPMTAEGSDASTRKWLSLRWWNTTKIGEIFGADLRSLALLRIVLACLVLADLVGRVPNLRVHYTDEGVLPRELVIAGQNEWRWSLNLANGSYQFQALIFLIAGLTAIGLLIGYRTRLMSIILWVVMLSILVRNPLVLSGADALMRLLLFWAMLLPLGACWSVDARLHPPPRQRSPRVLSFATIGIFFQIAFVYWFTATLKSSPEWRTDGTALYYALHAEHITKPFGEYLQQFPDLLKLLTHASLGLEYVAPALLFCPFFTGPVRTIAIASLMMFHLGIFLTMDVGIFPWTGALCMVCFLPGWFWERVLPRIRAAIPTHLPSIGPIRDTAGRATQALRLRLAAGPDSRLSFTTFGLHPDRPSPGNPAAPSSGGSGVNESPEVTTAPMLATSPLVNLFAAFCLVFVFLWNLTSVTDYRMPAQAAPIGYGLNLYQEWNMFAPRPPTATVWYVVRGVLRDGTEIDLLTPIVYDDLERVSLLSWQQPDDIVGTYYRDKYWRKYLSAIVLDGNNAERREFAAYSCRIWNAHYGGDVELAGLQFFAMRQSTTLDDAVRPVTRQVIAEYRCV